MKRVLFVDDEPNILQGLRRMLRSLRREWEMHFAGSGAEGLEILAKASFDVVVSDMKMPGMDGAEFMTQVKARFPDTVRIILSGHSEKESVMRSVGPTHQYLAKPCEPEVLKATIMRADALKTMLDSEPLNQLVGQLDSVPSLPALYQEVVAELQNPSSSLERVGVIIGRDVGMSAKILRIVNSAYFGLLRPVNSVPRAVAYLGLETVTALVLSAQLFTEFDGTAVPGFSIEALWRHSMDTGALARGIAKEEGAPKETIDDAFMAGTLHDVGTLILAGNLPDRFVEVQQMMPAEGLDREEAERAVLGATHGEVGACVMGIWGLPDSIVEAIAYHACPREAPGAGFTTVALVHAADALADEASGGTPETALDLEYLEGIGKAGRVPTWRELGTRLLSQETEA